MFPLVSLPWVPFGASKCRAEGPHLTSQSTTLLPEAFRSGSHAASDHGLMSPSRTSVTHQAASLLRFHPASLTHHGLPRSHPPTQNGMKTWLAHKRRGRSAPPPGPRGRCPRASSSRSPCLRPTKQKHSPASEGLVTQAEARAFMAPVTPGLSVPHDGLPAKGASL